SIQMLGSDEQRARYAEPMARGEILGAFALTEPTHGSDSVSLETTARKETRDGVEGYVLNGEKKWIGNGSSGHITVVWARLVGDDGDGQVHGFVVPQDTPGYTGTTITGKVSLRDRKSTRLNSSHVKISYAVFCLKKKTTILQETVGETIKVSPGESRIEYPMQLSSIYAGSGFK